MIYTTRKLFAALVVSLFVLVISLPGIISAASLPPVITSLKPVTEGMVAPVRIAMDKYGNYYMTDPLRKGVLKYNPYGKLVKMINVSGVPLGIAVATNDNIIVTQGTYASILDQNGVELHKLGIGVGQFIKANAATVGKDDANQKIYVTDGLGNEVQVFDLSGNLVYRFGSFDTTYGTHTAADGSFHNPSAIVYEKAFDQIAVADTFNGRIQFFKATDYSHVTNIGKLIDDYLGFVSPEGIAFEYTDGPTPLLKRMYVADTFRGAIQVIDTAAPPTFLSYIGSYGNAQGQLQTPSDLVFDKINSTGRLLVVNGAGNLQIYGVDGGLSPSDSIPPQLTITTVPNNTSDPNILQTPPLSGTVEANAVVKVTIDNTAATVGAVTVISNTWSCPITGLISGPNTITVTATDAAENKSTRSVTVVYTPPAPNLTITTVNNSFIKQANLTLNGTVDPGATVLVTNTTNGASGNAFVNDSNSTWTYPAAQIVEGSNNYTVTASKPSTTAKNTQSVVVILDMLPPTLSMSAIPSLSYSATSTQNIAGKVVDLHPATVTMTVNGGAPTTVTTTDFSFSATLQAGLPAGNTIDVTATDMAGNNVLNRRVIYYDPAKPLITISTPADNSYTKNSAATISGTVTPADAILQVKVGANDLQPVTVTAGAWSYSFNLAPDNNGLNSIGFVATSGVNSAQEKRTITLDLNAPALAITSPAQDTTTGIGIANIPIIGTVTDVGSPVTLTATINNGVPFAVTVNSGAFQFDAPLTDQQINIVQVTAKDSAGNITTTAPRNIFSDRIPPTLTFTPNLFIPKGSANPLLISGTVETNAGTTLTVTDGGYTFPVTFTPPTWTANLAGHSYNPATIKTTATDVAGNKTELTGFVYIHPTGDITADGSVTIADAAKALSFVVNPLLIPTAAELSSGDIGPLLNGKANPNGVIDITDAMIILRMALDPTFSLL